MLKNKEGYIARMEEDIKKLRNEINNLNESIAEYESENQKVLI